MTIEAPKIATTPPGYLDRHSQTRARAIHSHIVKSTTHEQPTLPPGTLRSSAKQQARENSVLCLLAHGGQSLRYTLCTLPHRGETEWCMHTLHQHNGWQASRTRYVIAAASLSTAQRNGPSVAGRRNSGAWPLASRKNAYSTSSIPLHLLSWQDPSLAPSTPAFPVSHPTLDASLM